MKLEHERSMCGIGVEVASCCEYGKIGPSLWALRTLLLSEPDMSGL